MTIRAVALTVLAAALLGACGASGPVASSFGRTPGVTSLPSPSPTVSIDRPTPPPPLTTPITGVITTQLAEGAFVALVGTDVLRVRITSGPLARQTLLFRVVGSTRLTGLRALTDIKADDTLQITFPEKPDGADGSYTALFVRLIRE